MDRLSKKADKLVRDYAFSSSLTGFIPIPLLDALGLIGVFRYIIVVMAAMFITNSAIGAESPSHRLPVFRVETEGKEPADLGAELGQQVKERFPDLESHFDRYLADAFTQEQFDNISSERVKPLRATAIEPAYLEELRGLAGSLNLVGSNRLGDGFLSLDELWFLQLIPDIGGQTGGWAFGVYGARPANHSALIARNFDLIEYSALRGLQAITVFADSERSVVNMGFAGILSIVTGFNDHGLFLAYLEATPTFSQSERLIATGAIGFDLRRTLETQTGFAGAMRDLSRGRYNTDHSILLAGPKRVQVLEHPLDQSARLRKAASSTRPEMTWDRREQIAAVGCFALSESPANCHQLRDRYRWQRLRALARFKPEGPHARMSDLAQIVFDRSNPPYALFGRSTVQSMVFDPQQQILQLYATPRDGRNPEGQVMQHYSHLAVRAKHTAEGNFGGKNVADGIFTEILAIWLLVALLLATLVYTRWRQW